MVVFFTLHFCYFLLNPILKYLFVKTWAEHKQEMEKEEKSEWTIVLLHSVTIFAILLIAIF